MRKRRQKRQKTHHDDGRNVYKHKAWNGMYHLARRLADQDSIGKDKKLCSIRRRTIRAGSSVSLASESAVAHVYCIPSDGSHLNNQIPADIIRNASDR